MNLMARQRRALGLIPCRSVASVVVFASIFLLLSLQAGCAYFNLFYNARKTFREANEIPRAKDGSLSRQQIQLYDGVIEKCDKLITTYPNSRWVDDAVLLLGRCYYEQGKYDETIQTLRALEVDFAESDLNREGQVLIAQAYLKKNQPVEAVEILKRRLERYPKSEGNDLVLYILGTTSLRLGEEGETMVYLERLTKEHPESPYRLKADIEMAEIFLEREAFERSLSIYQRIAQSRLEEADKIRCLSKLSETYIKMSRYGEAMDVLEEVGALAMPPEEKAAVLLLKAAAYVGLDSLEGAIDTYLSIGASYPKSVYSAEGYYQLGVIYQERLDSLEAAREYFEKVPREIAESPFAAKAIKRSSDISKLIKLQDSLGEGSDEGKAFAQLSLAEVQLFEFQNLERALAEYQKVLDQFPQSEVAPKAAYAIGHIYGEIMGDTLRALQVYRDLIERFPDSQQATYARRFLEGARE